MKKIKTIFALASVGLLTAACAGDPLVDREAAVELEPMAKPASLPQEVSWTGTSAGVDKLVSNDGGKISWMRITGDGEGCTWSNDGWFSPTWEWKNCDVSGGDGQQQATKEGDIWPLTIGNKEVYEVTGKSEKYDWQVMRTCVVKDAVLLTVAEAQYPTYEVVCSDKYAVRTWYISPELGKVIRYKRVHHERGVLEDITAQI